MSDETQVEQTQVEKDQPEVKQNQNLLLGAISYESDEAYGAFLSKIDVNQAVFVLVAASKYAQAKGAFSLSESELIASAIRRIKKKVNEEENSDKPADDSTN
jgi:hypothetical protein